MTVVFFSTNFLVDAESLETPSGIPYSELEQEIDDYVQDYIGKTTAGASVIVVKDGKILVNRSFGYADLENQVEVNADTVFEWGSATKLLVWTSVMQLVEQGKLDLDKDIRAYLPEGFLKKLQYDKPITMMNLMHHDAGWEDRYLDLFYLSPDQLTSLEEALLHFEPAQINEPGKVVGYSNYGTALAGFIVEEITEQPFYTYVNENIFDVLGMDDTSIHPAQKDQEDVGNRRDLVQGYYSNNEGEFSRSSKNRVYINIYPAGDVIGTGEDAAKFVTALMPKDGEHSPLFKSNVTLNQMLSASDFYDNGLPRNAHGFWVSNYAVETLGHAGNTDSFSANFTFSKEENLGIVVLTNQAGEIGLSYGLSALLFGEYPAADAPSLPDASEVEGDYMMTRVPHHGFTKLYSIFMMGKVEALDESTINTLGMTFKQVAPYEYVSIDEMDLYLHFSMDDGQVTKVSMMTGDLEPIPGKMKWSIFASLIIAVIFVLSIITAFISMFVSAVKNRRKVISHPPIKRWYQLINIAGLAVITNIIIMAIRTFNYTSYAAVKFQIWLNIAYMAIVIISVVFIMLLWKKTPFSRWQKAMYILSSVAGLLFVSLLIGWEFYR